MPSKMTTKTLQELGELLGSEQLCYKKCCNYVASCTDPVLKTKLGKYADDCKAAVGCQGASAGAGTETAESDRR